MPLENTLMLNKKQDLSFFANAKLLLTGEYFVMHGANALAIPLKYGQTLTVSYLVNDDLLHWTAADKNGVWFNADIKTRAIIVIKSTDETVGTRLQIILKAARTLNPQFLLDGCGYCINTYVDFDRNWGLGTSSTLIVNIAKWAGVDAFKLHCLVSKGSGYDIACATSNNPIVYKVIDKVPVVIPVEIPFMLQQHIYFIYLGNKQDTTKNIENLDDRNLIDSNKINLISSITNRLLKEEKLENIMQVIIEHEDIVEEFLHEEAIQKKLFHDFNGVIKSLGAWGGDFCMVISSEGDSYIRKYFNSRGYITIFQFNEIVKQ